MVSEVILFTYKSGEIDNFLNRFYSSSSFINNNSYIKLSFLNPLELSELIAAFSDNNTLFDIDMWISLDKDVFIKNCEIGYWIGSQYWGLGITKRVVKMFCDYLFSHFTITKIYAEIYSENIASCHVLEANGFQKEGYLKKHVYKNNNYHDLIIYGLREEEYEY